MSSFLTPAWLAASARRVSLQYGLHKLTRSARKPPCLTAALPEALLFCAGVAWTEDEHLAFLAGLRELGKVRPPVATEQQPGPNAHAGRGPSATWNASTACSVLIILHFVWVRHQ